MRSHLVGSYKLRAVANVNKEGPIPIWTMVTFEPLVESTEPQSLTSHLHALSYASYATSHSWNEILAKFPSYIISSMVYSEMVILLNQ